MSAALRSGWDASRSGWDASRRSVARSVVRRLCQNWLSTSDLVFVWVDQAFATAYGTLVEVGWAHELGKPIYFGLDAAIDDGLLRELWLALDTGIAVWGYEGPQHALVHALADWQGAGYVVPHDD
jgi:hypothetical protein